MVTLLQTISHKLGANTNNVIAYLERDHQKLRALIKELKEAKESESKKVKLLLEKFKTELKTHSRAEEKSFYGPLITQNKDCEIHVLEGFEEHILIDAIVGKLSKSKPGSPAYQAQLEVTQELLEHHLKDEEKEHFPLAFKVFDMPTLKMMGKKYETLKKSSAIKESPEKGQAVKNLKVAKNKVSAKKKKK